MTRPLSHAPSKKKCTTALFTVLGLLTTLSTIAVLWQAKTTYFTYLAAREQHEFDLAANRFIKGLFEVLMERLATNNALQGAEPAAPSVLSEIDKRRAAVKSNFAPGLAALMQLDFPNKAELLTRLQEALRKADEVRNQADLAIKLPRDQRDETLRKTFIPVLTDGVNASLKVWFSALYTVAKDDAKLQLLASIKEIGWQMRDTAGKERSNVSSSISAGTPLTPQMIVANAEHRAKVDILWESLQHLTNDPAIHPAIKMAMNNAQEQYFRNFRARADEVRKLGADGARYPMTATQYVDESTSQLGTLLEIMHAAGIASEAHTADLMHAAVWDLGIAIALVLLNLGIAAFSTRVILSRIAHPLSRLSAAVQRLTENDLSVEIPTVACDDEMRLMATSLTAFKAALIAKQDTDRIAAAEAQARSERSRRIDALTGSFETVVGHIVQTVSNAATQLEASANTLTTTAERSQQLATSVATTSGQASGSVHSVASAAEQLSSSVNEISRQIQDSTRIAGIAVGQARKTNEQIGELSKAAARIGDVVELINSIAGQTNLLALNATIEAARAGEAGRGFAVVASEVKALAEQTAKATGQIGEQVAGIQAATGESVSAIRDIGSTIERLSEISSAIAAAVEQQGVATQEIARNIQHASNGTQKVSTDVMDVERGASATCSASSQVLAAAQSLADDGDRLKTEVGNFLASVRAA